MAVVLRFSPIKLTAITLPNPWQYILLISNNTHTHTFIEAGCDHLMFLSFDIYKGEAQKKQPTKQTNKKNKNKKREK